MTCVHACACALSFRNPLGSGGSICIWVPEEAWLPARARCAHARLPRKCLAFPRTCTGPIGIGLPFTGVAMPFTPVNNGPHCPIVGRPWHPSWCIQHACHQTDSVRCAPAAAFNPQKIVVVLHAKSSSFMTHLIVQRTKKALCTVLLALLLLLLSPTVPDLFSPLPFTPEDAGSGGGLGGGLISCAL